MAAIKEGGGSTSDNFMEHLDLARMPGKAHRQVLADLLRRKTAGKHIGAIIVEGLPAINFPTTELKGFFPEDTAGCRCYGSK